MLNSNRVIRSILMRCNNTPAQLESSQYKFWLNISHPLTVLFKMQFHIQQYFDPKFHHPANPNVMFTSFCYCHYYFHKKKIYLYGHLLSTVCVYHVNQCKTIEKMTINPCFSHRKRISTKHLSFPVNKFTNVFIHTNNTHIRNGEFMVSLVRPTTQTQCQVSFNWTNREKYKLKREVWGAPEGTTIKMAKKIKKYFDFQLSKEI